MSRSFCRVPTYTAAQIRDAEAPLLAAGAPLMQRASSALARVVIACSGAETERTAQEPAPSLLVLVGSGNNGGDALFAAAALTAAFRVDLVTVRERHHAIGLDAALAAGARRIELAEALEQRYTVILDGMVGIGAAGEAGLQGLAQEAVQSLLPRLHTQRTRVVAVDIPSGLHPDTGAVRGSVLPADLTVTFGGVKHGLTVGRGPELAGEIVLVNIGLTKGLSLMHPVGEALVREVCE